MVRLLHSGIMIAKQAEYTQNLPMIQQMVNSFQIDNNDGGSGSTVANPATTAASGAGSSSSSIQNTCIQSSIYDNDFANT